MTSRAPHDNFEAAAAESLTDHCVSSAPIDNDGTCDPILPLRALEDVTKTAQIPFPFLADIADEYQVGFAPNFCLTQAHGDGDHGS